MTVLGTRALNRALLARQLLLEPSASTPLQVIEHLVGMQAQSPTAPYFGIWTRSESVTTAQISELISSRAAVRIALHRSTLHLVSAADCLTLRPLLAGALGQGFSAGSPYGKALAGIDRSALADQARSLLEQAPLTTAELAAALQQRHPGVLREALLNSVRADLPLVQVPPRGLWGASGQPTLTTAESWLGRRLDPRPAAAMLIRRYLAAFGPAGVRDVQAWSGLTRLAEVVEPMRAELLTFRDEGGVELFDLPGAPRPDPELPVPIKLLPEFDNVLLSYADRSRIIDEPTRASVFTVNGIIRGTVLIDGFVRATWKFRQRARTAAIEVRPLARLTARTLAGIEREALAALRFAAPDSAGSVRVLT